MAQRIFWDINEAVILLDGLLAVYAGKINRKDAITAVSAELRERARNKGIEIDEIFRNTNGISLRMAEMEYILTRGQKGMKPHSATKVFQQAVDLYRYHHEEYVKTLQAAKGVSPAEPALPLREQFFAWLAAQVSAAQLSELYIVYADLEEFCATCGVIKRRLFDVTAPEDVLSVMEAVSSGKFSRLLYKGSFNKTRSARALHVNYKKTLGKTRSALQYYYRFLQERAAVAGRQADNAAAAGADSAAGISAAGREDALCVEVKDGAQARRQEGAVAEGDLLDFQQLSVVEYTKPTRFIYGDTEPRSVKSWKDLYLQVVRLLLDDYPIVLQGLLNRRLDGRPNGRRDFTDVMGKVSMVAPALVRDNFYLETNFSAAVIAGKIKELLDLCGVAYAKLQVYYTRLDFFHSELFIPPRQAEARQEQSEGKKAASVAKLVAFCLGKSGATVSDVKKPQEKAASATDERYARVLAEYFGENGYQPGRALFYARFRSFYQEKYGCEPADSNEAIDAALRRIGMEIDGKIFPRQDNGQNSLLSEIVQAVLDAFADGATAVYVEAVYAKYRNRLAEKLHIYNEEAMAKLILDRAQGRFTRRYAFFTNCANPNPAGDLLRVMQGEYQPLTYEAIGKKAWFIPYGKIKKLLGDAIVNVAQETYFYAPNLPLSETELAQVSALIAGELAEREHLTDAGLRRLLEEKYPGIAVNTQDYTTYGLRNCLAYLLREKFAFNGSVITALGKKSRLADVFAEFAAERAAFSVDELLTLRRETGAQNINWDAVLSKALRISATQLVRRDQLCADVDAVDDALAVLCPGDYLPLAEVNLFSQLPNVGYAWNGYLLESYLFSFSKKFRLLHASFSGEGVFGAMARRTSVISDYRSLVVDALARARGVNTEAGALAYLVEHGYQKRKSYSGIGSVLREAKLLREQLEKQ